MDWSQLSAINWNIALLFVALIVGHCEILVAIVNRLHATTVPERTLRQIRHLHDLLIVGFPLVLIWRVGFGGPALLFGGDWQDLGASWQIYAFICAAGFLAFLFSVVRWQISHKPALLLSNHSETVDFTKRIGHRPVGEGPYRWMTPLPGNEIFRVQVSDKTLQIPRLPAEWDGLSILHLSDTHFIGTVDRPFFEAVFEQAQAMQPDLIVFTGDLMDRQQYVEWLPSTFGRLSAPLGCYFILGNHDWNLDADGIRAAMTDLGWQDVHSRVVNIKHRDHPLAIGGTEQPWMGGHPDWLQADTGAFRLLLSHTPDHFDWAKQQQVDLMLSGHNHGGQVVLPVIGPVYSPSLTGTRYAGGLFWQAPTMLCVSRGLSGQHPLRWNCLPELTKLVLRPTDKAD